MYIAIDDNGLTMCYCYCRETSCSRCADAWLLDYELVTHILILQLLFYLCYQLCGVQGQGRARPSQVKSCQEASRPEASSAALVQVIAVCKQERTPPWHMSTKTMCLTCVAVVQASKQELRESTAARLIQLR